ncbi:hypothetical protein Drorol1_Dr00000778 [Drosera rotundifolia]
MAKVSKVRQLKAHCQRFGKDQFRAKFCSGKVLKHVNKKRPFFISEKKDWKGAVCSVCMEFPHNAVLLLCSSYNKGCRPYMCATSCRFSNCLDQYRKAYTKLTSADEMEHWDTSENMYCTSFGDEKTEASELLCPLCRGQVKGWTVVQLARKYLDKKKRVCLQENCTFVGNYKQLKKHVKTVHPFDRPREMDPVKEQRWKALEAERARRDAISTVTSSLSGAIIVGDYVIETNFFGGSDLDVYTDDDPFLHGGHLNGAGSRSFGFLENSSGGRRWADFSRIVQREVFAPAVHHGLISRRVMGRRRNLSG